MILIFVVPLFILLLIEKMLLSLLGKIRKARWRRAEKRTLQKQEALIDNEEAVELQEDNQEEKQEQE